MSYFELMYHPTEKDLFRRFKSSFEFPFQYQEIEKSENPDFLIYREKDILGIEITEIFKKHNPQREPAPLQAIETGWAKTCEQADKLWSEFELPNIEVSVDFNDHYHVNDSNIGRLAKILVKIAGQNIPDKNNFALLKSENFPLNYFPDEILSTIISRSDNLASSYWHFGHGGFVPELKEEQIIERITKKNKRVDDYLKKCNEVWLLLIIHGWR